jgi:hypothetical protein
MEQTSLVAEHLKKMTYRELYDLAETLHVSVKSWHEDGEDISPDDYANTLLVWAENASPDET